MFFKKHKPAPQTQKEEIYIYKSECGCESTIVYGHDKYGGISANNRYEGVSAQDNSKYIKKCDYHNTIAVENALRSFWKNTKISWRCYRLYGLPYLLVELNRVSGLSLCELETISNRVKEEIMTQDT